MDPGKQTGVLWKRLSILLTTEPSLQPLWRIISIPLVFAPRLGKLLHCLRLIFKTTLDGLNLFFPSCFFF